MDDRYHFIGIGGIGMSSLAMILMQKGIQVSGSDDRESEILEQLRQKGAEISFAKQNIQKAKHVIYGTAISENHPEYQKAKRQKKNIAHRSDLLAELLKMKKALLVTGTHGKTTTTALLAHVLHYAKKDPSFSIGGEVLSLPAHGYWGEGDFFIAEADESDRSFLRLKGYGGIITNIEEDHLEFWKDLQDLEEGFCRFMDNISSKNHLFWCYDDPSLQKLCPKGISYGKNSKADLQACNIRCYQDHCCFDVIFKDQKYEDIKIPLIGEHNVLNALAVFGMSLQLNIPIAIIRKTFLTFQGVKRRLEKIGEHRKTIFYEDYAHHPTEVKNTLLALRKIVQEKKIIVVYQPHRYSRLKYFKDRFHFCFDIADEMFITDVYSVDVQEEKTMSVEDFIHSMQTKISVQYLCKEDLMTVLPNKLKPHDVVIFLGAGDITDMGKEIYQNFLQTQNKYKVVLIFGGKSPEHEISCISAKNIYQGLDPTIYDISLLGITKEGRWKKGCNDFSVLHSIENKSVMSEEIFTLLSACDICMPILHGPNGEDGMVAAFLQLMQVPYIGSNFIAAGICMNKTVSKKLVLVEGILTTPFVNIQKYQWTQEFREELLHTIQEKLQMPLFVKSPYLGSSIGCYYVENTKDLQQAIEKAFAFGEEVLIEEKITGQEVEVAILGNDDLYIATPGEILTGGDFYSYERKYYKNPMSTQVPAALTEREIAMIKTKAQRIYRILGCQGLARIDFFVDKKRRIFFNEINPIPGLTHISLYTKMFHFDGMEMQELVNKLIIAGLHYHRKRQRWAQV